MGQADVTEGFNNITIDVSDSLVKSLEDKLQKLPPLSSKCSISRVPVLLRERNEKAFTPREISIGPLHHNNGSLKHMEEHKLRLLRDFLSRAKVSLRDCVELLEKKEVYLRNCYADPIEFDSDKFIEIILVDSAFILELFFRNISGNNQLQDQYDHFLAAHGSYDIPRKNDVRRSAIMLTYEFFKRKLNLLDMDNFNVEEKNLLCPSSSSKQKQTKVRDYAEGNEVTRSWSEVQVKSSGNPFDIKFKEGVLEIPRLRIKDDTEILLRNLIAYERCHLHDNYVNDFVFILDRLVETPGDVELLTHCGVIESKLSGTQQVASLMNNLCPGVTMARRRFYFSDLCEEASDYCRVPWHKWRLTLKENYFSNPWAIISVVAAISLLLLTLVQTVYEVISYYFK
ncbi:UPF0481 protein At3g47200-like [Neltuma alba]|uniref:UPF0481 protein At3g47200-like n=1 Tax=Neltuma alba TaxID=207710 RepID=UPI0010A59F6B|nr:UPF0481 protein At3g47200-like [Prosopis alba]